MTHFWLRSQREVSLCERNQKTGRSASTNGSSRRRIVQIQRLLPQQEGEGLISSLERSSRITNAQKPAFTLVGKWARARVLENVMTNSFRKVLLSASTCTLWLR